MSEMVFSCDLNSCFKEDFLTEKMEIVPGECIEFTWTFHAPEAGIYRVQWDWARTRNCKLTLDEKLFHHHHDFFTPSYDDLEVKLIQGTNLLSFILKNNGEISEQAFCRLRVIDHRGFPVPPDLETFTSGIGGTIRSAGRFGFSKGDGVLDYSMPAFGIVARPGVFGYPEYKSNNLWQVSFLPPGIIPRSELEYQYEPEPGETVSVDWTGVRWFNHDISFSYSLLTPFLLIEAESGNYHIENLHFSRCVLKLGDHYVVREAMNGSFYNREKDGELATNLIVFFGNKGEFPEIPLMIVLSGSPECITSNIEIVEAGSWIAAAFPCGSKVFHSENFDLEKVLSMAEKLHPLALARPTSCVESFKLRNNCIDIMQQFEFREFSDSLGLKPRRFAPLPPVLGIGNNEIPGAVDLGFFTKYGPLHGVPDSSWSRYVLPLPEYRRSFPLTRGTSVFYDFREFVNYHESMQTRENPGAHSFLYHWTVPLRTFTQLDTEQYSELISMLKRDLKRVCSRDTCYAGPGGRKAYMWYERTEPFTKVKYLASYLHVCLNRFLSSFERKTVESHKRPFMEFDWGNAIALYAIDAAAFFTGDSQTIQDNWLLLRKVFDYFLVMQDYACMMAPLQENGRAFGDGASFGAYPAFARLAEMSGNQADLELALYAYAKFLASRRALFRAGWEYFPQFYGSNRWMSGKTFNEEIDGFSQFNCYPGPFMKGGYRADSIYNLSTEGIYPEAFRFYAHAEPEMTDRLLDAFENVNGRDSLFSYVSEPVYHSSDIKFAGTQEVFSYLALGIYRGRVTEKDIVCAYNNNRIPRCFLGIPIGRRRIPEEWAREYLLAELRGLNLPFLCDFRNLQIKSCRFPEMELMVLGTGAYLYFSNVEGYSFTLDGISLTSENGHVVVPHSGTLRLSSVNVKQQH